MARADRATWAKRVERWKRCGLSVAEFAEKIGVNARTLAYWRWRLGRAAPREAVKKAEAEIVPSGAGRARSVATSARPREKSASVALSFIEVARRDVEVVHEPFELVLVDGLRVRVPPGFDGEALGRLLDVVEHRR
jgi:transposase-like protein